MKIGVLKEIKCGESRVIVTPVEAQELINDGNEVLVEKNAGYIAGFYDEEYVQIGAQIVETREAIYESCNMILKVKEFFKEEYNLLRNGQIVFACIHPASNREEVDALLKNKVIAFTAEDTHRYGSPNCEVAGKLGALMGVQYLLNSNGGRGQLISGIGGAPGANAIVLGAGIVGKGSIEILSALGAQVTVMARNVSTMRSCHDIYPANVRTMFSNQSNIRALLPTTDLVVNCVKWSKDRTDHLITREMLSLMKKGSVIVDISADLDGAIETYRPTTHEDPVYEVDGIIHYGVDNIPGAAAHTTSIAYAASVLPHIRAIANKGVREACIKDGFLRRSLTVYNGILTHKETSIIQNREWSTPEEVLDLDIKNIDLAPSAT